MTLLMEWTALMATLKVGEKHFYFIPMENLEYIYNFLSIDDFNYINKLFRPDVLFRKRVKKTGKKGNSSQGYFGAGYHSR